MCLSSTGLSETKLSVDQTQMCAQACVRLARARDSAGVVPELEQYLLGRCYLHYFETFKQAEGVFASFTLFIFFFYIPDSKSTAFLIS